MTTRVPSDRTKLVHDLVLVLADCSETMSEINAKQTKGSTRAISRLTCAISQPTCLLGAFVPI